MRELDEKKLLNGDVIDGIMMEDKKEVDKVILTGAELSLSLIHIYSPSASAAARGQQDG